MACTMLSSVPRVTGQGRAQLCQNMWEMVRQRGEARWKGRKWRARKIDAKKRGRQSKGGERLETDRRGGWLSVFYGQI